MQNANERDISWHQRERESYVSCLHFVGGCGVEGASVIITPFACKIVYTLIYSPLVWRLDSQIPANKYLLKCNLLFLGEYNYWLTVCGIRADEMKTKENEEAAVKAIPDMLQR